MRSLSRAFGTLLSASLVASVVAVAAPAQASPAPAAPPSTPESGSRADAGAAVAAARLLGRKIEVLDATTETRRRWANPDGTMTDELYAAPVRTRRDGRWVSIDTTLRSDGGTVRPAATVGAVTFSGGGDRALATVSENGVTVSLRSPKPLPVPVLDGSTARYTDVLPGVDIELTAVAAGYEQSFVLKNRAASAAALELPLVTQGMRAVRKDGATAFVDAHGTERAWVGSARMWDAAGREAPVGIAVARTTTGSALRMTPDAKLLARTDLTFPVTVDPTVQIRRWVDTYADSGNPTLNYGTNGYLKIGKRTSTYRSFIAFDLNDYANKHITDVYTYLGNVDSVTCSAKTTTLYQVTSPWTSTNVTWNNQPTADLTSTGTLGTATTAFGGPTGSTCDATNWMTFHDSRLTTLFDKWANYQTSNYGMTIRTSETDTQAAKDFLSGEATSWAPRANITYNTHPGTVAGRAVSPAVLGSDNNTRYAPSTTPTLFGGTCDAESSPVRIDYEVWNSTNTTTGTLVASSAGTEPTVASCGIKEWTVPTALTNGSTYYWRARAYDGTDYSYNWASWVPLVIDTSAPNTPDVSFSSYPENTWSAGGVSQVGTVSANGSTDVVGYYAGLDEPEPSGYVDATNVTLLSPTTGPHTFYLRSVDRAGNKSATRAYAFGVGDVGITNPAAGARTEKTFNLTAGIKSGWGQLTWQWRRSATDSWTTMTGLKDGGGSAIAQPLTVSSGVAPTVTWDAEAAVGTDGPFEISATVSNSSGTPAPVTTTRTVSLDRTDFGSVTQTEAVGPGSVNLLTGNYAMSATDVSIDTPRGDLTLSRTFNSRAPQAGANGPFGPGWVSSIPVSAAGSDYTSLAVSGSLATVTTADGDTVGFTKSDTSGNFTPEYGAEDVTLMYSSTLDKYDLTDLDGNVTSFTLPTGATSYVPSAVTQAGSTEATTYSYQTVTVNSEAVTRVTGVVAPKPSGVSSCSPSVTGCRSLTLTYAASTVTPPTSGQFGDYPDRLQKVEVVAYDPELTPTPGMRTLEIAHYAYDSTGRLAQAWDARLPSLKTLYTYNPDGQVATMTPPAEEAWTFAYAPLSTEASGTGRLKSVSRPTLLMSPTTATTTVVYRVPTTTGAGGPYDLSSTELARSGQVDLPTSATAIFPATTSATFGSGSLPVPSSYDHAAVVYLNADGREVNTVDANGGVTTTEHDGRGNVIRTLSAGNRERALAQGTSTADEAAIAARLSSTTAYSASGLDVLETWGPEHNVRLAAGSDPVRAREHVVNTYDESTTGGPYHLLTTSVTSARVTGETTDRSTESRTTKTQYGTTTASWTLGLPTASIVDAGTGGLSITTRSTYTADGRVLTQTLPAGGTTTNTAATRVTRYYSSGVDAVDAACGLHPEWADLVCTVAPGGQPTGTALPTTRMESYTMLGAVRVMTEKNGATTLRTSTTTYDGAGRPLRSSVTGTGTALPTQETYWDGNGRATETRILDALGTTVTAKVTRVYNTLGQLTSYTDSDSTVAATTTYDLVGRPLVTYDGKGTQTWTYDGGSEKRGLVTSLVDSQAGTWTATYDTDGTPTVDWPNGLRATSTVDESGSATALSYAATSGCTGAACVSYAETIGLSIHDQWAERGSTQSAQDYTYDGSGRLTRVDDTVGDSCTVRKYTFDAGAAGNGNRTKLETFDPATDHSCQTTTAASTVNSTFDAADRITTTGTVYDALGRTTTVPDADALDSGNVTIGYYVSDFVYSLAIGGTTKTYTPDVDGQRIRSWMDGTTTRTNHYDSDSDSPSWTQEGATPWTRNVSGITGDLAAVYSSATSAATLQLTNLHGDVVATTTTSSTTLATMTESTELGTPRGATGTRYGWLGGKQRASDTAGGVTLMGVRVYNPATGRFTQADPVYGGNSNAYAYPADPLTQFDLDGRRCLTGRAKGHKSKKCRNPGGFLGRAWGRGRRWGGNGEQAGIYAGCALGAAGGTYVGGEFVVGGPIGAGLGCVGGGIVGGGVGLVVGSVTGFATSAVGDGARVVASGVGNTWRFVSRNAPFQRKGRMTGIAAALRYAGSRMQPRRVWYRVT